MLFGDEPSYSRNKGSLPDDDGGAVLGIFVTLGIIFLVAYFGLINVVLSLIIFCLAVYASVVCFKSFLAVLRTFRSASGDLPRLWDLFSYILPHETRARVYEPSREELHEDYLLARRKYRTKAARRWLAFCFTARSVCLVTQCFYVMLGENGRRLIKIIILVILGERAAQGLKGILYEIIRRL